MTTLKDIASIVGVHPSTVSYVLNGKGDRIGVRPERAARILEVAQRLGYRPNAAARSVRRGRFKTLALVLGYEWGLDHLPSKLLSGLGLGLNDHGLNLLWAPLPNPKYTGQAFDPGFLNELSCDGLIISWDENVPPELTVLINRHRIPAIWINLRREADCVHPDDFAAGKRAAEHLLALGHRRIAYSNMHRSTLDEERLAALHYSLRDRRDGCAAALRTAGLALMPGLVNDGQGMTRQDQEAAAERLLRHPDRPTAVFCYADDYIVLARVAQRLGLGIPVDLSVICCANLPENLLDLELCTLVPPSLELGRQAVALLEQRIAQPDRSLPPLALPFDFVPGMSCAPPPGG